MSFKVIDVDISKKVIDSACCDKQHVCAILKPLFMRNYLFHLQPKFGCLNIYNFVVIIYTGD